VKQQKGKDIGKRKKEVERKKRDEKVREVDNMQRKR
jgi:hypothetical protein